MSAPKQLKSGERDYDAETQAAYDELGIKTIGQAADFWLRILNTPETKTVKCEQKPVNALGRLFGKDKKGKKK